MGEIADMMIDGTLDMYTGEYLGRGPGYPRTADRSLPWEKSRPAWSFVSFRNKKDSKEMFGVKSFIYQNRYKYLDTKLKDKMFDSILQRYAIEKLGIEGTVSNQQIVTAIQSNWGAFKNWLLSTYKK